MPTLRDAIAAFDAANEARQIPDRKSGGFLPEPMPASRRDPIVSNVKVAVENLVATVRSRAYAAAYQSVLDESGAAVAPPTADAVAAATLAGQQAAAKALTCPADIYALEIGPFLASLPAYAGGNPDNRKDRQKRASNVKLFISVVAGIDFDSPRPVSPTRVHEPWRCLYEPLMRYVDAGGDKRERDKRRNLPGALLRLQDLLLARGHAAPAEVPDRHTLRKWLLEAEPDLEDERANKRAHWYLGAYRTACRVAGLAQELPQHYELIEDEGIGIKSLGSMPKADGELEESWMSRARDLGFEGDFRDVEMLVLVRLFAPKMGLMLDRYLAQGRSALKRGPWAEAQIDMASWAVASLIRLGVDPREMHWPDLFLERRTVSVDVDEERDEVLNDFLAGRGRRAQRARATAQHSLLRRCLDLAAPRSWANSPLWLVTPRHELDPVPRYTEKLEHHLDAVFVLTREMYGRHMQQAEDSETRADWGLVVAEYEATAKHVADYNQGRPVDGRKDKSAMLITWPQAICMGLPYLRKRALELRVLVEEARERRGHLESRSSRELLARYDEALREWIVATIMLDDCLRVKNYAGARAGEHVVPLVRRGADGRWLTVVGLETHWRGIDAGKVALKMWENRDGNPRTRDRTITPALLDSLLLTDYWLGTRRRALASASILKPSQPYDPDQDRWAFIVTPRPQAHQHADPTWYGDMTTDMVSDIFGSALYRMCREVLHLDLPPWDSSELTTKFRALFSAHVTRLAVGSYLGGLRNQWTEAEELTDDMEDTLRKHYSRVQKKWAELKHVTGSQNPHHFDAVIDRMRMRVPEDDWATFWRTLDPEAPETALRTMIAAAEVARHGLGSVAARRQAARKAARARVA
ncbi:MAG TPA: hypothetical protein VFS33_05755 [Gemmatimonadales bacterium]|nr:hypothetical protein [Gemmatimonadales bacterium]